MSREQRLKQLTELIKAFSDPFEDGETVYHYTSPEGLRGIVTSGEIWLTNAAFVNDTTEGKAFQNLKREDALGIEPFPTNHIEECWELSQRVRWEGNNHYIASFSKAKDMLQQFRAYGPFCIGFRATELMKRGFHLYDCVYSPSEIREWIRGKSLIEQWKGDHLDDPTRRAGASSLLFAARMKYKSKHYSDEREVRLVSVSNHTWEPYRNSPSMFAEDPPIHFRDRPAYRMPIPYVKFFVSPSGALGRSGEDGHGERATEMKRRKLKEETEMARGLLPISEVWLGPMMQQEQAKLACEIMLCEKGYKNVPVIASQIPYRGS